MEIAVEDTALNDSETLSRTVKGTTVKLGHLGLGADSTDAVIDIISAYRCITATLGLLLECAVNNGVNLNAV